ncbi:MAG: VOC family protein [Ginsengibacter sp.]
MDQKVNPIPKGYGTVTPYLLVDNVANLIEFMKAVFSADVLYKLDRNDGTIMHAEIKIGNSIIMVGEPMKEYGSMPASIYLYVADCDSIYQKALQHGATSIMEVTTMYHAGERYGGVKDLCGNIWWIATHIEDLTAEEQAKRIKEMADK